LRVQHEGRSGHARGGPGEGPGHLHLALGGIVALDDIYKEVILDHYKSPRNKRELPGAELRCTRNNPLCGDEITVYVHEENGKIAGVSFTGAGCSISQSSASMMTEAVGGSD